MKTRVITALVLAALLLPIIFMQNILLFNILVMIISVMASLELFKLHKSKLVVVLNFILVMYSLIYYNFPEFLKLGLHPFSIFLLSFIILSAKLVLKNQDLSNFTLSIVSLFLVGFGTVGVSLMFNYFVLLIFTLIVVLLNDIFAYHIGVRIGKRKLSPEISPKKTIEGAIGGITVSSIAGTVFMYFHNKSFDNLIIYFIIAIFIAICGIIGDLFASKIKRDYKIKDFSNLLPGHGGILDRFDSLIFCSLVIFFLTELGVLSSLF